MSFMDPDMRDRLRAQAEKRPQPPKPASPSPTPTPSPEPIKRFCFFEAHAREKLGQPPEWQAAYWKAHDQPNGPSMMEVGGGVYPLLLSGKNKGKTNWKKPALGTKLVAFFTDAEHKAFRRKWELANDKCSTCFGTKEEWAGWSASDGNRFRPCTSCHATGKPRKEVA